MSDVTGKGADERATLDETPREVLARAKQLQSAASGLRDHLRKVDAQARRAYEAERARVVQEQLARMPLDSLKSASEGRLRLGAVEAAGLRTVAAVQAAGRDGLKSVPGVGEKTATQVLAGAQQIRTALHNVARVRFDVDERPDEQTELLAGLYGREVAHRLVDPLQERLDRLIAVVDKQLVPARLEARRVRRFFSGRQRKERSRVAFGRLVELVSDDSTVLLAEEMAGAQSALSEHLSERALWDDYLSRSVAYNGLLIEVSGQGPDEEAMHGFLPEEIVERIRGFELDTSLLLVSLRGYQSFGAKFALVQRHAILGDEMGLGKTIEALAVLSHLRAQGATHFLVVSPASVIANWEHEIARHTRIERTWRLHGPDRDYHLRHWARLGGIGVTTFDTLRSLEIPDIPIAAVIVDEAHYVKNPDARRTQAVQSWLTLSELSLLMSGTPMENHIGEFRTLVHHVRPDVAATIRTSGGIAGADAFRKSVAPVYLRRNQTDVLEELPSKIETAEWLSLEGPVADVYRAAVAEGNFMAMRRAAFLTQRPRDSPKLGRILEIAEEAADNGRKVVVFSYFRDVIDRVHTALGSLAVGPLTGSVSATERQRLVDHFSSRKDSAVLVSQIEAGGVGLNIQAASVVVLTEPQWKPSTEDQAIARCHRLGQVRPVEVHRLLTENSVDERMLVILARKSALFAEYVRQSAMKDAAPEAIDITDDERTTEVASQAEQERRIIELERRRLGLNGR
ncbi:MAG: SNF2-related protein [Acidimicrobiaceae bacterium]|nr:SNF2-related protein [Acidimicrobiaceae bacterium]